MFSFRARYFSTKLTESCCSLGVRTQQVQVYKHHRLAPINHQRSHISTMGKRLVLAIDGTWVNSDNGYNASMSGPGAKGRLASPSNVTRICRAVLPRSPSGVQQLVYYQGGLGSDANAYSFVVGGYLGSGIDEAIREAYSFLAMNYEEGDEIFLVGFSRGAFTARSVGSLIAEVGLLTKTGLESFYPIFKDWENQNIASYEPGYESAAWPIAGRPKFGDKAYNEQLAGKKLTRLNIPIKAIAVFDTVGTLGVPDVRPFGISLYNSAKTEYSFVNTQVAPNVENAYQALALDEQRYAFAPTVWESPRDSSSHMLKELKQCWFPGVHTTVGGGFQDTNISDITLAWMLTQLSQFLAFDEGYLLRQRKQNGDFYIEKKTPEEGRGYGLGLIKASDGDLLNTILGRKARTPGEYLLTDPKSGEQMPGKPLLNTREFMHPSVRYRMHNGGRQPSSDPEAKLGEGAYAPKPLADWTYIAAGEDTPKGIKIDAKWAKAPKWVRKSTGTYIVEDKIVDGSLEAVLAETWSGVGNWLKL
ncbi:hypothetical protein CKM354_000014900 [Cercospora kikuchii]|uniref:T6SS Phospholipase effector Tle1-like catalytic domain-containing protein n=1 Tax=Cercospora kikuchii TaxID=84275 RepID=A0A9P3C8H5_9PEZI|nr:uncharacterized protein CKM354_000014900 [Cercospora kikuchii]GIZ36681.1 hypothetical protein CKM354_000014900 [Cercospora kikuchii]